MIEGTPPPQPKNFFSLLFLFKTKIKGRGSSLHPLPQVPLEASMRCSRQYFIYILDIDLYTYLLSTECFIIKVRKPTIQYLPWTIYSLTVLIKIKYYLIFLWILYIRDQGKFNRNGYRIRGYCVRGIFVSNLVLRYWSIRASMVRRGDGWKS